MECVKPPFNCYLQYYVALVLTESTNTHKELDIGSASLPLMIKRGKRTENIQPLQSKKTVLKSTLNTTLIFLVYYLLGIEYSDVIWCLIKREHNTVVYCLKKRNKQPSLVPDNNRREERREHC